ncbi:MAG: hypothetical protein ABI411_16605 [Tahibacter sp.]
MNEILNRLMRDWPERHAPYRDDFATDAKSLRTWLNHLPLANPAATSRQLLDALVAMNHFRIDPQERLDALEILRAPVEQVVATLDRQILAESLPLPLAKMQWTHMVRDFERELASGYAQALHDFCMPAGKVPFLKGRPVATAATRALQHFGQCLTKVYMLYHTPPAGIWLRLHDVFLAASFLRIDDRGVADPLLDGAEITPRQAYAHAVLLALSNPYRYNQRDMADVFALTRAWAPYVGIAPGADTGEAFGVDTDADRGPGYVPGERAAATRELLAIDPIPVQRMIEGHVHHLPPGMDLLTFRLKGGPNVQARHQVVERLIHGWSGSAERSHARLTAGHLLDSVIGLHGLHYVLSGNEDFDSFMRRVRGQVISMSERDSMASWANQSDIKPPVQSAKVLDQSLGGYHLIWEQGDQLRAKVGELVGLAPPAETDEEQDWMVGVIRWIRVKQNGAVDAGVELLARRAQPVGVASFDERGAVRAPARGVLLMDIEATGDALTVLAPQAFDARQDELELTRPPDPLDWEGEAMVVRLDGVRVVEMSGTFQRLVIGTEHARSGSLGETMLPMRAEFAEHATALG